MDDMHTAASQLAHSAPSADSAIHAVRSASLLVGGIKLGSLAGIGIVGGLLIAAVDPTEAEPDPRRRRRLIVLQGFVAGVFSTTCTLPFVRWLDYMFDWINLGPGSTIEDWFEIALPVALFIGALSWGIVGALAKLRRIIRDRAADDIARRLEG